MITLYTGVPGAGKTYKMVADLDDFITDYNNKATSETGQLTVITNIRELKLPHIDFDEFIMERFPDKALKVTERIEKFFDYDYQQGLNEHFGGPIMYLIDECQRFFPKRTSLPNTEGYLQRHRHLGHNIYLATQAIRQVNGNVVCLVELEYFAAPRTKSLFGEFRYHIKTPNSREVINVKNIRPQQRIFDLYKSFDAKELQKPKKLLLRKLWPLLLLPLAAYLLISGVGRIGHSPNLEKPTGAIVAQTIAPNQYPAVPDEESERRMAALQERVDNLQAKLDETERVFLAVIEMGDRKFTVDPDTHAVVDVSKIKHKVYCVNGGLTCYYDRPVVSAIKMADTSTSPSTPQAGSFSYGSRYQVTRSPEPEGQAGEASFVDSSMFEDLRPMP